MKNGTPLWREAHFQVKMYKTPQGGTDFASSDVKKWYAAVARNPFSSQNAQNTKRSEQFFKFRCSKMARRCGAKHIFNSKCAKHQWRTNFGRSDPEKMHAAVARSTFVSQNVQNATF